MSETTPTVDPVNAPIGNPTAQEVLEAVRSLSSLLREDAREGEKLTRPTPRVIEALDAAGVFRVGTPASLGGYDLGVREQVEVFLEIARADGSPAWAAVTATLPTLCAAFPQETIDEVTARDWVGPLVAASVFDSTQGHVAPADGGWTVHGSWRFASNIQLSAWLLAGVQIEGREGPDARGVVLLERGQYEIQDDWHVMGLVASNSNSVRIDEPVFVPERRLITTRQVIEHVGNVQNRFSPALAIGTMIASLAVGVARGALDAFLEQGHSRQIPGLPYSSLATAPSSQIVAGKVDAEIRSVETVVRAQADRVDELGAAGVEPSPDDVTASFLVAAHLGRRCSEAVDLLQMTLGASSTALSNPLQRAVRDIHVINTHGAMRIDGHAENHGAMLFGQPRQPPPPLAL